MLLFIPSKFEQTFSSSAQAHSPRRTHLRHKTSLHKNQDTNHSKCLPRQQCLEGKTNHDTKMGTTQILKSYTTHY